MALHVCISKRRNVCASLADTLMKERVRETTRTEDSSLYYQHHILDYWHVSVRRFLNYACHLFDGYLGLFFPLYIDGEPLGYSFRTLL